MGFDLEKEALIASGLRDEERIRDYLCKFDSIFRKFLPKEVRRLSPLNTAEKLFKALWMDRPNRYRPEGFYRFNDVIDAQCGSDRAAVGNCLGLTLLYNCLIKRLGIKVEALYLENAFNIGPHVLTVLRIDDLTIDVENIFPDGFDYKGHKQNPTGLNWGDKALVADIYQSRGTELFLKGKLGNALDNYEMALKLNPNYEKARLNKAILLDRIKLDSDKSKVTCDE
jgi:tetratricopeptide (TPR) repeat protein